MPRRSAAISTRSFERLIGGEGGYISTDMAMLQHRLLFSFGWRPSLLSRPATSSLAREAGVLLNDEYLLCEQKINGEERFF